MLRLTQLAAFLQPDLAPRITISRATVSPTLRLRLHSPRRLPQQGFTLIEALIALALLAIVATLAVPPLLNQARTMKLRLAAHEIATTFQLARSQAVTKGRHVAVKFRPADGEGQVHYALFFDGDGDGVRNADIDSGKDPAITPFRPLRHLGPRLRFGFPSGKAPRHPSDLTRRLDRLEDPLRFNRSDLASFSPLGTATPGSAYLTDSHRGLAAVRVLHTSGRVQVLYYDQITESWQR
ncbi:MAG: GspH/FimT family protein [Acidobacteriota bacterium]